MPRPSRRPAPAGLAPGLALPAAAHQGWRWTDDGGFGLTGTIAGARLGNPHGLLTVTVDDETWTVEVGQPWRSAREGLTEALLARGTEITARGHRAADPVTLTIKAERIEIGGQVHDLCPDRT
jgi:hypothetical protein